MSEFGLKPLGEALKRLRNIEGLTQKELAKMTGCSQAYISSCETGKPVSFGKFEELLDFMGYTYDIVLKRKTNA